MPFKWKLKGTLSSSLKPCEKKDDFWSQETCVRQYGNMEYTVKRQLVSDIKEFCCNNDKVQIHVHVISSSADFYILWEHFALDMKYKLENVS